MLLQIGNKRNHTSGFTLIEVLVALTILTGSVFVLINTHYSALNLHVLAADEVNSRTLLENAVAKAEMGIVAEELTGEGDFGSRYPGYSYSYEALEMGGEEGSPILADTVFYRVTATLNRPDGESTSLEFLTFSNAEMQTVLQSAPAPAP